MPHELCPPLNYHNRAEGNFKATDGAKNQG
jgi:hypothetical protein